jgi:hypothetical protein
VLRLFMVNSLVRAVAKKVVVMHAKTAASRGSKRESWVHKLIIVSIVYGSRRAHLDEMGARIFAAFMRALISSDLKDQGRPWKAMNGVPSMYSI